MPHVPSHMQGMQRVGCPIRSVQNTYIYDASTAKMDSDSILRSFALCSYVLS